MKTFKEFLESFSEFENSKELGIFLNPTDKEISMLKPDVRGIVTKNGDFYVANNNQGISSLHNKIIKRTRFLFGKEIGTPISFFDKHKNGTTVQRVGKTKIFALGEIGLAPSKGFTVADIGGEDRVLLKKVKGFLKAAKKKNPKLVFRPVNINIFEGT